MRLFIALPLPDEAKGALAELQTELRKSGTPMKLVERENLHMTLRFIGEGDAAEWIAKLETIEAKPFDLLFDRIGAFPGGGRINVVWAGCEAPESLLKIHRVIAGEELALQHDTAREGARLPRVSSASRRAMLTLARGGRFPPGDAGEELSAHVTLARVKGRPDDALRAIIGKAISVPAHVGCVQLMNSVLGPEGPSYEVVYEKAL